MSEEVKMNSTAPEVKSILVVSAHNTDWIWRCSGTVARYKKLGAAVHVVCLSAGVRGESNKLLKEDPTLTPKAIKALRVKEAVDAGAALGCDSVQVWDYDDCMLECSKEIVNQLAARMREFPHVALKGLMAIPPVSEFPGENCRYFAEMRNLFVDIKAKKYDNVSMECLSMGMSDDFTDAIAEGSTMVRIGTAIFGKRNYNT